VVVVEMIEDVTRLNAPIVQVYKMIRAFSLVCCLDLDIIG